MKGLTVGRMVHYVSTYGDHLAAVITQVFNKDRGDVGMAAYTRYGICEGAGNTVRPVRATYSETPEPGTWHWIERED